MTSVNRSQLDAKARGKDTFYGPHCYFDGTHERYVSTGKCVKCVAYANAIRDGLIDGIDNRTEGQKAVSKAVALHAPRGDARRGEINKERSEAIKRGIARKKQPTISLGDK